MMSQSDSGCTAFKTETERPYTVGSMFAGIGGICLAFKNAGGEIVWANELDRDACQTYRTNFGPSYLVEGDVKQVSEDEVPEVEILTAGFPCQAFSVAGYRKGFRDERGTLIFEVMRIISAKRPRVVFLENVKNLVGHDGGRTFASILSLLKELGYISKHAVLNTMEYGNIPQNRERIYIVGFRDRKDYDGFEFPSSVPLTKGIRDIVDASTEKDSAYYYNDTPYNELFEEAMSRTDTAYQWRRKYVRENKNGVCPTLTANMGTGGHNVPIIRDEFGIRKLTPEECLMFQGFPASFRFAEISRSSKYKQAGNSVSVPVVQRIAENIMAAMRLTDKAVKE